MTHDPLFDALERGTRSLGLFANTPDMVELCAHIGFDWFVIDQMFSANDWSVTQDLIRAGRAAGISPVVRVQSNPWLGPDRRVAVDVTRVQGLGARFISISHADNEDFLHSLPVARDWHAGGLNIHRFESSQDWQAQDSAAGATVLIPQPETLESLTGLPALMARPDVRMVFIAMTDAARILSNSPTPQFDHPAVWEYLTEIVRLGNEHNVMVGTNTSFAYTLSELVGRVDRLYAAGVRMVMAQTASFLFQTAVGGFVKDVKALARD